MMRIAALVLLLAVFLIACNGESASQPEPTTLPTDTTTQLATATPTPGATTPRSTAASR